MERIKLALPLLMAALSVGLGAAADDAPVKIGDLWYILYPDAGEAIVAEAPESAKTDGRSPYTGEVTIPASVTYENTEYAVTEIEEDAFHYSSITKLVVAPDGASILNDYAFFGVETLEEVELPWGVMCINDDCFRNCTKLKKVTLPLSALISPMAFNKCPVATVTVVGRPGSALGEVKDLFAPSAQVTLSTPAAAEEEKVKVGSLWYSVVEDDDASYAVVCAPPLSEAAYSGAVTIPDKVSIEGQEYAVQGISSDAFESAATPTIQIPTSVTEIGRFAFRRSGLTSVTLPVGLDLEDVESFDMFDSCTELASINIDEGNDYVSSKGGVLLSADGATLLRCPEGKSGTMSVPDGVTTIEEYAFYKCEKLTSIALPTGLAEVDETAFQDCPGLANLAMGGVGEAYKVVDGILYTADGTELVYCPEAWTGAGGTGALKVPDGVTSIGEYAFESCAGLRSVTLPASVTKLCEGAFYSANNLQTVTFGSAIGEFEEDAFYGCGKLNKLTLPMGNASTIIGDEVFLDTGLKTIDILGDMGGVTGKAWFTILRKHLPTGITYYNNGQFYAALSVVRDKGQASGRHYDLLGRPVGGLQRGLVVNGDGKLGIRL